MIVLNGEKYAENDREFINSLFSKTGTCQGYAKRLVNSVRFSNHQRKLFAIMNRFGVLQSAEKIEHKTVFGIEVKEAGFDNYSVLDSVQDADLLSISSEYKKGEKYYKYKA